MEIAIIATDFLREIEQTLVSGPVRLGLVGKLKSIRLGRVPGHIGLEENMALGLRDEAPHRHQRSGQHASLAARQTGDDFAPFDKFLFGRTNRPWPDPISEILYQYERPWQ